MTRAITLASAQWTDQTLEEFAQRASEWGYQGLELACAGDHFEVQRAQGDAAYCPAKLELLARNELRLWALSSHGVGQAVSDRIEARHQQILPEYVWGDGQPAGVQQRAAEELQATAQAAQKLGLRLIVGSAGSPLGSAVWGYPQLAPSDFAAGLRRFASLWQPVLKVFKDCGVRYALEVQPGCMAHDIVTAEAVLEALNGAEEFGFTLDPSHLHWQGIDPVEFIDRFADRIYQVHVRDVSVALNGRTSVLCGQLPQGDRRRGWSYRSPGHGGVDWEAFVRALNDVGYTGSLCIAWEDAGMNREQGATDAVQFVRRLDFEPGESAAKLGFSE